MSTRPDWIYRPGEGLAPAPVASATAVRARRRFPWRRLWPYYVAMAVAVATVAVFGTLAVGRALDVAGREYVLVPDPNGAGLLECERTTDVAGRVFYDSCTRVPAP